MNSRFNITYIIYIYIEHESRRELFKGTRTAENGGKTECTMRM